jgi:hypothetical protein
MTHLSIQAEYLITDLGTAGGGLVESSMNTARVGLNYRF